MGKTLMSHFIAVQIKQIAIFNTYQAYSNVCFLRHNVSCPEIALQK